MKLVYTPTNKDETAVEDYNGTKVGTVACSSSWHLL